MDDRLVLGFAQVFEHCVPNRLRSEAQSWKIPNLCMLKSPQIPKERMEYVSSTVPLSAKRNHGVFLGLHKTGLAFLFLWMFACSVDEQVGLPAEWCVQPKVPRRVWSL